MKLYPLLIELLQFLVLLSVAPVFTGWVKALK